MTKFSSRKKHLITRIIMMTVGIIRETGSILVMERNILG